MTVSAGNAGADSELRRNSLGLPELVFQGVTHIAPATNIVFTFPIIAAQRWTGHAALIPALRGRLPLYREYRGAVFPVHAIERRLLFIRHSRTWQPERLHGHLELPDL